MRMTVLLAALFASMVASAAPISPLEGFQTTEHSRYELNSFWKEVSKLNRVMKGDDCFKRAMLWSYKLNKDYGVYSKKVYMHYTQKFIRELDDQGRTGLGAIFGRAVTQTKGWGFHVAPVVNIEGKDYVLDPHLRPGPESVEQWVEYLTERGESLWKKRHYDLLGKLRRYSGSNDRRSVRKAKKVLREMRGLGMTTDRNQTIDIKCKKIDHIMEFDRHQENAWCFYQEAAMYYFAPLELRFLNYGSIYPDQRYPVTDLRYHTEENFQAGRNYVLRDWDYSKVKGSLDEIVQRYRPERPRNL